MVLTPGLVLICVALWGSRALWWAFPLADAMLLCAVLVVWRLRRWRGPIGDATREGTP
jgi:Na+-driven multidrug efflux pump